MQGLMNNVIPPYCHPVIANSKISKNFSVNTKRIGENALIMAANKYSLFVSRLRRFTYEFR